MEKFDVEVVICKTYTGTIESFNEMIDDLGDDRQYPVMHIDEIGHSTWKFTGTFYHAKTGLTYRPNDCYIVRVKDNKHLTTPHGHN